MQSGETHVELKPFVTTAGASAIWPGSTDLVATQSGASWPASNFAATRNASSRRADRAAAGSHRAPLGRLSQHPRHRPSR